MSQDNEEFEKWHDLPYSNEESDMIHNAGKWRSKTDQLIGWNAARKHYAPKLTEAEMIQKVAEAIFDSMHEERFIDEPEGIVRTMYINAAYGALSAAGMKFAEAVNQEGK